MLALGPDQSRCNPGANPVQCRSATGFAPGLPRLCLESTSRELLRPFTWLAWRFLGVLASLRENQMLNFRLNCLDRVD